MEALTIIEGFNPFEDKTLCLSSRFKVLVEDSLGLERVKKTLGHGVVPTIPFSALALQHVPVSESVTKFFRTVLTASVRVKDESRSGLSLKARLTQSREHELSGHGLVDTPPNDLSGKEIHNDGQK